VAKAELFARRGVEESRKTQDEMGEAEALTVLGGYLIASNEEEALRVTRKALDLTQRNAIWSRVARFIRFSASSNIGYISVFGGRIEPDAEQRFQEAFRIGKSDPMLRRPLIRLYGAFSRYCFMKNDRAAEWTALEDGLRLFRELPNPNISDAFILDYYRNRLARDGDYRGAERASRERYELNDRAAGPTGFLSLNSHIGWGMDLGRIGEWQKAAKELTACRKQQSLLPARAQMSNDWILMAGSAYVENRNGNPADAEGYARKAAVAAADHKWDAKDPRFAEAYLETGIALRLQKHFDQATAELTRSRDIYSAAWGAGHKRTLLAAGELARAVAHDAGPIH